MGDGTKRRGTIVVVGAHPDDETLGCGGAVARRIAEGHEVVVVVLTPGEKLYSVVLGIDTAPTPEEVGRIRQEETRRSTRILGVRPENLVFLSYGDGRLAKRETEATEELAGILRERQPVEVWSLSDYEHHADHVAAARIARAACARAGGTARLLYYIVSLKYGLTLDAVPLEFRALDISAYLPQKREAVSQFRSHLGTLSPAQKGPLWQNADAYLKPEELFADGG
jgi:LmbE family N-acetylglucosaminyl deacetylase